MVSSGTGARAETPDMSVDACGDAVEEVEELTSSNREVIYETTSGRGF